MPTTRAAGKKAVSRDVEGGDKTAGSKHQISEKPSPDSKRPKKIDDDDGMNDLAIEDKMPRLVKFHVDFSSSIALSRLTRT